jgi:hypothetical protein
MNIELEPIEVETLSGWIGWFLESGSNELYPDAIEILTNVFNKLTD